MKKAVQLEISISSTFISGGNLFTYMNLHIGSFLMIRVTAVAGCCCCCCVKWLCVGAMDCTLSLCCNGGCSVGFTPKLR